MGDVNDSLEGRILSGKELDYMNLKKEMDIQDGFEVYRCGQRHYLIDSHGDEHYVFSQYNMGAGCGP
jgi:hypothetical protein